MQKTWWITGCIVSLSLLASAAVLKEGKAVIDKDCKVEIVKMEWGLQGQEGDRLKGAVRLFGDASETSKEIKLTFDVYNKKAEKIETIDAAFTISKYGLLRKKAYCEGDFMVDFSTKPEANRLTLVNLSFAGEPVTYKTSFNLNGTLMKTKFALSEPKQKKQE